MAAILQDLRRSQAKGRRLDQAVQRRSTPPNARLRNPAAFLSKESPVSRANSLLVSKGRVCNTLKPMTQHRVIQGGCFCRKIRFEIQPQFGRSSHCHCEDCRKTHSSAFVSWHVLLLRDRRRTKLDCAHAIWF
jgi:hypothetical protein